MRGSLVSLAASLICWAVCTALMTGLVKATVKPDCLLLVSVVVLLVSRASTISTCLAAMSISPFTAITSLPTCRNFSPASRRTLPSVLPTVLFAAVVVSVLCLLLLARLPMVKPTPPLPKTPLCFVLFSRVSLCVSVADSIVRLRPAAIVVSFVATTLLPLTAMSRLAVSVTLSPEKVLAMAVLLSLVL